MKKYVLVTILLISLVGCQTVTPPPTSIPPTPSTAFTATATQPVMESQIVQGPTATVPPTAPVESEGDFRPFVVDSTGPFADVELVNWQPASSAAGDYTLPVDLTKVTNQEVIAGFTQAQQEFLVENGFVVLHNQEDQFSDIRERVSKEYGQPYYRTTDEAYHALHLTFDELLKALEKEHLRPRMFRLVQKVLEEVSSYLPLVEGTSIEADARLAAAYLSVAVKLFDPQAVVESNLEEIVTQQIDLIMAGEGRDYSIIIPGFEDDYGAYKPVGHYAGDEALENYFRGMTWLGRVHFNLTDESEEFVPSRVPLIITLALRRAHFEGQSAAEEWGEIHEVLSFLVGPSDDGGPLEYATLMDEVYSRSATVADLAHDDIWKEFLARGEELPAPQINSTFVNFLEDLEGESGWRFMGQRFTLDAFILQNLVFNKVGTFENKRQLPSGLDVMAALGSEAAYSALVAAGETGYFHYPEQMVILQQAVSDQPENEWLNTFYSAWLYVFFPQLNRVVGEYPAYMGTEAWAYKDLNSALGSWAELKHDTALYTKMPEFAGGGGPPSSGPAPGYVEPNPAVFYRLAYVAGAIAAGLTERGMMITLQEPETGDFTYPQGVGNLIIGMERLGDDFQRLGDIAAKQQAGVPLDEDDLYSIQSCLGPVECQVLYMQLMNQFGVGPEQEMPPVPVIAAVAGAEQEVLEVGVGGVDRIYVVVPSEAGFEITQGGVFSYFEFPQPRSNRMTDEQWRERLETAPPSGPGWVTKFRLNDGEPVDYLAFRVGDIYIITEEGENLNLREGPSTSETIIAKLQPGEYVEIVDGPASAEGYTWWRVSLLTRPDANIEGWVVESQEWYERAWGQ
ncbi:MAG: DUF3160 domain-containing protein [Gammaproteobacteria bacterium]|nr:DUF3160 domain-containing protein [Gammaproteobacteria bacterium]